MKIKKMTTLISIVLVSSTFSAYSADVKESSEQEFSLFGKKILFIDKEENESSVIFKVKLQEKISGTVNFIKFENGEINCCRKSGRVTQKISIDVAEFERIYKLLESFYNKNKNKMGWIVPSIIPTYKREWCKANLELIFKEPYKNFRVIEYLE